MGRLPGRLWPFHHDLQPLQPPVGARFWLKLLDALVDAGAVPRRTAIDAHAHADALRRSLRRAGAVPVIPGRNNRKRAVRYDRERYKARHLIENAFCLLADFRRAATRYDKLAANFSSGAALATALAFWL